ncbi:NAD(P)-binding domain-containing protein [Shinella sp.]|uniref:NAD(P)-binding domain-containing protein n=1 Tax=Shinella sp. TaxID=1870904 RepID=UPI0040371396
MLMTKSQDRTSENDRHFVLVIGGGQSGLATGYYLKQAGIPYLILEKNDRVGDTWRNRYSSLTLFTPRSLSMLPGLTPVGNRDSYPTRDEFADYLERYASTHRLSIKTSTTLNRLRLNAAGQFEADLSTGERLRATSVVVTTGAFRPCPCLNSFQARRISNN